MKFRNPPKTLLFPPLRITRVSSLSFSLSRSLSPWILHDSSLQSPQIRRNGFYIASSPPSLSPLRDRQRSALTKGTLRPNPQRLRRQRRARWITMSWSSPGLARSLSSLRSRIWSSSLGPLACLSSYKPRRRGFTPLPLFLFMRRLWISRDSGNQNCIFLRS